jgi:hypothetical protein
MSLIENRKRVRGDPYLVPNAAGLRDLPALPSPLGGEVLVVHNYPVCSWQPALPWYLD